MKYVFASAALTITLSLTGTLSAVGERGGAEPSITSESRELALAQGIKTGLDLSPALTTLFTPEDPTLDAESQLIQSVIDARKADSGRYTDSTNPYRIRYLVQSVQEKQLATRLADARDAGVYVQIVEDYKQLDPAYPWLDTDEYLSGRGFTIVDDHTKLTAATRLSTQIIGVRTAGFMHLKARLFEIPGQKTILTGGQNASTMGYKYNEDALQIIRNDALYEQYSAAYRSIIEDKKKISNTWDSRAAINVLFSPESSGDRAGNKILEWIKSENTLIVLMVFSLRDFSVPGSGDTLLKVLTAKAAAGVPVYVITDKNQADGQPGEVNDPTEDKLRLAGVHVYEVKNDRDPYASMHTKATILGTSCPRVITDSANYSTSALGSATVSAKNIESVLFIDSRKADGCLSGKRYLAKWLLVLSRFGYQSARDDGEQPYSTVIQKFLLLAGWPDQPVTFTAHNSYTVLGEDVRVLGNLPVLGDWGRAGRGVLLQTDITKYPTWVSPSTTNIPLGSWFEWKLAVTAGGAPPSRWEMGANRSSFAQPPPFTPNGVLTVEGTWR